MHKKISNKEYIKLIDKNYSVPLSEVAVGGEVRFVPNVNERDSSITADWLLNLIKYKNQIEPLQNKTIKTIKEDNGIDYWDSLYVINSTKINEKVSNSISGNIQDKKQGKAGNLSMAYFTPYLNPLCKDDLESKGIVENCKILSNTQYELINMASPLVFFEDENDSENVYQVDLSIEGVDKIDKIVGDMVVKGLKPIRIVFKHISPEHAVLFNLKPINSYIRDFIYKEEILKYLGKKNGKIALLSSKELDDQGISIKSALQNKISNDRFYCLLDVDNNVTDIFLIKQKYIYFPFSSKKETRPSFNETSFANKKMMLQDDTYYIKKKNLDGTITDVTVEELDMSDILRKTNYKDINHMNAFNPKPIDCYKFLYHSEREKINEIIESSIIKNCFFSGSTDDEQIKKKLHQDAEKSESIYSLSKVKIENSKIEDIQINIKNSSNIDDVKFFYYDRYNPIPRTNDGNNLFYGRAHKESLSFEREKVLTVIALNSLIKKLKSEQHSDIEIFLEKQQPTTLGAGNDGFVDCIITSKKDGLKYGKAYEFKAWANMSLFDEAALQQQCDKYLINDFMISTLHIDKTYDNSCLSDVQGVNLDIEKLSNQSVLESVFFGNSLNQPQIKTKI